MKRSFSTIAACQLPSRAQSRSVASSAGTAHEQRWRASTSPHARARCTRCWGPTARARPRCCGSSRASSTRRRPGPRARASPASGCRARPQRDRSRPAGRPHLLHAHLGPREPPVSSPGCTACDGAAASDRAWQVLRDVGLEDAARRPIGDLLARHAEAPVGGARAADGAAGPARGRGDARPRSGGRPPGRRSWSRRPAGARHGRDLGDPAHRRDPRLRRPACRSCARVRVRFAGTVPELMAQ